MGNKRQQLTGNELCMKVGDGLNLNDAAYFASQSVKVPPSNHWTYPCVTSTSEVSQS